MKPRNRASLRVVVLWAWCFWKTESAFLLIANPEERGTDSPCPFLQEVAIFPGKMYTIVLTVGVFYLCFWDHLFGFAVFLCQSYPTNQTTWADAFLIDLVLGFVKLLYACMYLFAPPMTTAANTWLHFLAQRILTSYPFWACHLQTARNYFQFMDFYCFTMASKLHVIIYTFWIALEMKQEYESQWETTFCLRKYKPLSLF